MLTDVDTVSCAANTTVREGANVTLQCSARTDARSSAVISWQKEGIALNGSTAGVVISGSESPSQLTILGSKRMHAGLYKCVAMNNNSGVKEECPDAHVTVQCK